MTAALLLAAEGGVADAAALVEPSWHRSVLLIVADGGLVLIGIGILLCLLRVLRGPHLVDRAVALDAIAVQLVGVVVLLTLRLGQLVLFDGVLVLSLIGFAGTVAISQYVLRRRVRREAEDHPKVAADEARQDLADAAARVGETGGGDAR